MSPRKLRAASVLGTLGLLAASPLAAHDHVCDHTHSSLNPDIIACDPGATCTGGKCEEVTGAGKAVCECVSGGGCASIGNSSFEGVPGGLPSESSIVTYTTVADAGNFWTLLHTQNGALIHEFGPGGADLQGSVTLLYGSFSDPSAVPVEILDVSLTLPSVTIHGSSTGPNSIHLPAGPTQTLVYDSTLGLLETVDSNGLALEIDNDLTSGRPTALYLEAQVQSGGALLFGQGVTFFPVPAGTPSVTPGGHWLLGALLVAAAVSVGRARSLGARWARPRKASNERV